MSPTRIIPLVSLALVLVVVGSAFLVSRPIDFPADERPEAADLPEVELDLGELTLLGRVVDSEGRPVKEAGITTHQGSRLVWTWSDADGNYALTELHPGPLKLRVIAHEFEAVTITIDPFDETVAASARDLVLEKRISEPPTPPGLEFGSLAGSVDLGPHPALEGEYEVLLRPTTAPNDPMGGFPVRVPVDPDGSFRAEVVHVGEYQVVLLSPEDRGASGPDLLGGTAVHRYETGGDANPLTVTSQAGRVHGVVTREDEDDPSRRGTPLRGALVRAVPVDREAFGGPITGSFIRATRTDAQGGYDLRDLPPGEYELHIQAGARRFDETVEIAPSESRELDAVPR